MVCPSRMPAGIHEEFQRGPPRRSRGPLAALGESVHDAYELAATVMT